MQLSVIIPVFNNGNTLGVQLEALCRQDFAKPWELLVVNNGSTDGSMSVAERYRDRLPALRIVDASGVQGAPYARNRGMAASTGELLAFCDADDEVAPRWLSALAQALRGHPLVIGALEYEKLNEPWVVRSGIRLQEGGPIASDHPPYLPFGAAANIAFRRSVYEAIGPWDETLPLGDDADYCWRGQQAGFGLYFASDAVVHYRLRSDLGAIYRHGRSYGYWNVITRRRYDPVRPSFESFRMIVWMLRHLPQAPLFRGDKSRWAQWLWQLGWRVGQIRGSLEADPVG